jgi:hypothetical protein
MELTLSSSQLYVVESGHDVNKGGLNDYVFACSHGDMSEWAYVHPLVLLRTGSAIKSSCSKQNT